MAPDSPEKDARKRNESAKRTIERFDLSALRLGGILRRVENAELKSGPELSKLLQETLDAFTAQEDKLFKLLQRGTLHNSYVDNHGMFIQLESLTHHANIFLKAVSEYDWQNVPEGMALSERVLGFFERALQQLQTVVADSNAKRKSFADSQKNSAVYKRAEEAFVGLRENFVSIASVYLPAVERLVNYGDAERANHIIKTVEAFTQDQPVEGIVYPENYTLASFLYQHGSQENAERALPILKTMKNVPELILLALRSCLLPADQLPKQVLERCRVCMEEYFSESGLSASDTINRWIQDNDVHKKLEDESGYERKLPAEYTQRRYIDKLTIRGEYALLDNFAAMKEVQEKIKTDAPGIIFNDSGIIEFGRFPLSMLSSVYKNRTTNIPYGILISARHDHNQALRSEKYVDGVLDTLVKQAKKLGLIIRPIEIEGGVDCARRLLDLKSRFEKESGKILFGIVSGHGAVDTFYSGVQHSFSKDQLASGKGTRRAVEDFFAQGAPWVFDSCSTGAEQGIAHELSKITGGTVVAPEKPTSVSTLNLTRDASGKILLDATYSDTDTRQTYTDGEKVALTE